MIIFFINIDILLISYFYYSLFNELFTNIYYFIIEVFFLFKYFILKLIIHIINV